MYQSKEETVPFFVSNEELGLHPGATQEERTRALIAAHYKLLGEPAPVVPAEAARDKPAPAVTHRDPEWGVMALRGETELDAK